MKMMVLTCDNNLQDNNLEDDTTYTYPYPIKIQTSQGGFLFTDTGIPGDAVRIKKPVTLSPMRQEWTLKADDIGNPFTTYYIVNMETNNALTLSKASTDERIDIVTAPYIGMLTQRWYLSTYVDDSNLYYYFLNVFSGQCINVFDNKFQEDQRLISYNFSNDQNEIYKIIPSVSGGVNQILSEEEPVQEEVLRNDNGLYL